MKSNNLTMEDRLKKLYASLGLNVGAKSSNLAMIKSIFRLISAGKKCANYLM